MTAGWQHELRELSYVVPVPHVVLQDAGACPPDCAQCAADLLRPPPPAVTRRHRLRWWLGSAPYRLRWWLHDRLFPDCSGPDL